ncbi:hypothetical protein PG991_003253 [Apiospora marii]|uniref:Glycosyl transferase CAP10 domain-containing protein n=1 Tax=Apiospora marii TaxID=335849 RepID=A0ABR1SHP3_9PEZI
MWFKNNRESRILLLGVGVILSFLTISHLRSLRLRSHEYAAASAQWLNHNAPSSQGDSPIVPPVQQQSSWHFDAARDAFNYGLSDAQCDAAFPGLFAEIYRARDHLLKQNKTIGRKDVHLDHDEEKAGRPHYELHVLLHEGELYVLHQNDGVWPHHYRAVAGLSAFYRAMVALPDLRALPNVEFVLNADDYYARPDEPGFADGKPRFSWNRHVDDPWTWVMPDFGGWMFSDDGVQSYAQFRADVELVERDYMVQGRRGGWDDKTPKLAWRGSMSLGASLRKSLVDAAKGHKWNDVSAMEILADKDIRINVLDMADFCRYKYLAHTEGLSWSGRLRYLLNCESVPLVHEREWVAHFYPLLQSRGPHQNYVAVKRDWSDLADRMKELENNPTRARRIAHEVTSFFRDRYLTPAAEACYLRRMVTVYATVQNFEPQSHYLANPEDFEDQSAAPKPATAAPPPKDAIKVGGPITDLKEKEKKAGQKQARKEDKKDPKKEVKNEPKVPKWKCRGVSFPYYLTPAPYSRFGFLETDKARYEAEG